MLLNKTAPTLSFKLPGDGKTFRAKVDWTLVPINNVDDTPERMGGIEGN